MLGQLHISHTLSFWSKGQKYILNVYFYLLRILWFVLDILAELGDYTFDKFLIGGQIYTKIMFFNDFWVVKIDVFLCIFQVTDLQFNQECSPPDLGQHTKRLNLPGFKLLISDSPASSWLLATITVLSEFFYSFSLSHDTISNEKYILKLIG